MSKAARTGAAKFRQEVMIRTSFADCIKRMIGAVPQGEGISSKSRKSVIKPVPLRIRLMSHSGPVLLRSFGASQDWVLYPATIFKGAE
jgi:hypothetical protein